MSILINANTKVITQGLTGAQGSGGMDIDGQGASLKNHTVTHILRDRRRVS